MKEEVKSEDLNFKDRIYSSFFILPYIFFLSSVLMLSLKLINEFDIGLYLKSLVLIITLVGGIMWVFISLGNFSQRIFKYIIKRKDDR